VLAILVQLGGTDWAQTAPAKASVGRTARITLGRNNTFHLDRSKAGPRSMTTGSVTGQNQ
jgi:hypothetical protein